MPKNILESLSPDLAAQIGRATESEQRLISLRACQLAVQRSGLDEPLIQKALQLLKQGITSDHQLAAALEQLFGDLDDAYFAAEKRFKSGEEDEATYIRLALKARAADAVLLAFNDDPFVAVTWSIYEACVVMDGTAEVSAIAKEVIH